MPQDTTFDPRSPPFNAIVRITETIDGQQYQGSGVLVSPDEVLTAGHLASSSATNISVEEGTHDSEGLYSGAVTHTGAPVIDIHTLPLDGVATDYALIHLSMPVMGASTMQVVAGPLSECAHITGFPETASGAMVDDVQAIIAHDNIYYVDPQGDLLSPGISGSPVWTFDPNGQPDVTGIMSSADACRNYAAQFSQVTSDKINAWIRQDDTPQFMLIRGQVFSDTSNDTASIARLYHSALGRLPDEDGLQYWVNDLRQGYPLQDVAASFIGSPEFTARFGDSLTNAQYVDRIYENVLGREPEASGAAFWTGNLDNGSANRSLTLTEISESPENKAITAQLFTT